MVCGANIALQLFVECIRMSSQVSHRGECVSRDLNSSVGYDMDIEMC